MSERNTRSRKHELSEPKAEGDEPTSNDQQTKPKGPGQQNIQFQSDESTIKSKDGSRDASSNVSNTVSTTQTTGNQHQDATIVGNATAGGITITTPTPTTEGTINPTAMPNPESNQLVIQPTLNADLITSLRTSNFTEQFVNARTPSAFREVFAGLLITDKLNFKVNDFRLVSDIEPYIVYNSVQIDDYKDHSTLAVTGPYKDIIEQSEKMFQHGTAMVEFVLNDKFFGKYGIDTSRGIPLVSDMLSPIGTGRGSDQTAKYAAGLLSMLVAIMQDNRIGQVEQTNHTIANAVDNELSKLINAPYIAPVRPNPMLATPGTRVKWLRDALRAMNDGVMAKYVMGSIDSMTDPQFRVKRIETYGINIDQFSASILNYNITRLSDSNASIRQRINAIKAHSFKGTTIHSPDRSTLRPELPPNPEHQIRVLMLMAARYPRLTEMIAHINKQYVESTNAIRPMDKTFYYPSNMEQAPKANDFINVLQRYAAKADIDRVRLMVAMEMTPRLSIMHMAPIDEEFDSAYSIVVIFQLIVMCWLFPNQFNAIKGEVQNVLLKFFSVWYPGEYGQFMAMYGSTYQLTPEGRIIWSQRDTLWTQGMVMTSDYPSLFSGQSFSQPNIQSIMSFFTPRGNNATDSAAIAAKFPRVSKDPSHYNPFVMQQGQRSNALATQFAHMTDELMKKASRYAAMRRELPSDQRTYINQWFGFISKRFGDIALAFTNHLSVIYDTMSNFMLNFYSDFDGDFSTSKPMQYALVGANGSVQHIIEDLGETADSLSFVDTSIIWPLIGQCEFPLVKAEGNGSASVPISEDITFPRGIESYELSLAHMKTLENMALPDAFFSYIAAGADSTEGRQYNLNDETGSIIRVITVDNYITQVSHRLETIGWDVPLRITASTTLDDIKQYVKGNGPILQYGSGVMTREMLAYVINESIILIYTRFDQIATSIAFDPDEFDPRDFEDKSFTIVDVLRVDGIPQANPAIHKLVSMMPTFSSSQERRAVTRLAEMLGANMNDYQTLLLRFFQPMQRSFKLNNPQIRRVDFEFSVSPYDSQKDIEAFKWSEFFMNTEQTDRLNIAFKFIFKPAIARSFKGLRLMMREEPEPDPDTVPDVPEDCLQIEYEHSIFKLTRVGKNNVYVFVDPINGQTYAGYESRPKRHLIINSREGFDSHIIEQIVGSIKRAGWVVDVIDIEYTASIVIPPKQISNPIDLDTVLAAPKGTLLHIEFLDSLMRMKMPDWVIPRLGVDYKTIYPFDVITSSRSTRALVNDSSGKPPQGHQIPRAAEIDTGRLSRSGDIIYTTKVNKLDPDEISMTNPVKMFTSYVKLNEELELSIVPPSSLMDIRL